MNKGTVYALDGMLSIVLAVMILISANSFLTRIEFNKYTTLNPTEIGADIFNILERTNEINNFYLLNKEFLNNKIPDYKNNNHGKLMNNTKLTTNNFYQFSILFDGYKNYVELPVSNSLLKNDTDFTIIVWFNTKYIKEEMNLLTFYSHASGTPQITSLEIKLENKSGYKNITVENNYQTTMNKTSLEFEYNDNQNYMISVLFEKSQNKIRLNITGEDYNLGEIVYNSSEIENVVSTNFSSNVNAKLGTKNLTHSFFKGNINKLLIFNTTLSDNDLEQIYYNKTNIYTGTKENYIVLQYELQIKSSSITTKIRELLPIQYNMRFELENINNSIISTQEKTSTSIVKKYIYTGERILAIQDEDSTKIIRGTYYVWT
jgi:hypothetical protein